MPEKAIGVAARAGFEFKKACSCLLVPPESIGDPEQPQEGIVTEAGFVAMAFTKAGEPER